MPDTDHTRDRGTVLLVTAAPSIMPQGGRAMLSALNHAILLDLFGPRLSLFVPSGRTRTIPAVLKGHIDGIDGHSIGALLAHIVDHGVTRVILDGSNRGPAARAIKRRFPHVRVFTVFHNVEARFFLGALRDKPRAKSLAVLIANYRAERAAVAASDRLLCLSDRDGALLRRLYGRGADSVLPIAVRDQPLAAAAPTERPSYALFVGGGFYANRDGIRWFARAVAPRLSIATCVVGRGLDDLAEEFAGNASIEFVGAVDDLAPWYRDAAVVVAPIFDGSGMKTKVAEALLYGKHIVGTAEAFSGYADDIIAAGSLVHDADGFVAAIEAVCAHGWPAFDPAMRALYDRDHGYAAARARLAQALDA